MKKYVVVIEEVVRYEHKAVIEVDESKWSESELEDVLDMAQEKWGYLGAEAVADFLNVQKGIDLVEYVEDADGYSNDTEITDFYECDEEEEELER